MSSSIKKICTTCLAGVVAGGLGFAQQSKAGPAANADNRAAAYYNYAMGHLYAELASTYGGRSEYVDKAIEFYKQALRTDPGASFLSEELTDLYLQAGRMRDAVSDAQEMLRQNPDNLDAHRMLGRIYARLIGDPQQNKVREDMLKNSIEQYKAVTAKEPKDVDSWLMLGRLYKFSQNSIEAEKAYKAALAADPNNEYALSGLASVYQDTGDTKAAIEMWQRLSAQNPSAKTLRALASGYEQARDYKSAAATLRKALELAPDDPEVKRDLAENLLLSDNAAEALKLYSELAAADPKDAQIQLRLSQIYRQQHDMAKARAAQDKALAIDPSNLEVRYNEVSLLEGEAKYPAAIAKLKQIVDSTAKASYAPPERANRAILLERLALLYRTNEQYAESVQTFKQLAALDPDLAARATAQVVETYRQGKDYKNALAEGQEGVTRYPNDRTVRMIYASALADAGQTAQAITETKKLFDGKNDRETWLALAQIYDKTKDYNAMASALDAAEKLSTSKDDQENVLFMRGAMYEKLKKNEQAEAEFRKVLEINPQNASALNYLGYMLADRNVRLQEAHDLIRRAVDLEPNNGAYLDSLGWVNYRLGRLEQAETYLRQALERISRDPTVHDHLGDVYFGQGKLKDAIVQWEASLKEWGQAPQQDSDTAEVAKIHKKLEGARVRLARESSAASTRER